MSYTIELLIEAIIQFDITSSTDPSTSEVSSWITEEEAIMDAMLLGSYTASAEEIDVARSWYPRKDTMEWIRGIIKQDIPLDIEGTVVIPDKKPIISTTSMEVNDASITEAPSWTSLTKWDGSSADTDYLILTYISKAGIKLGWGWYFYGDNKPDIGKKKIKATYTYGYNLPSSVLQKYATLKVAIRVLDAAIRAGEPTAVASYTGGDFQVYINTQIAPLIERLEKQCEELEDKYFPEEPIPLAITK